MRYIDILPALKDRDSNTSRCQFLFHRSLLLWFPAEGFRKLRRLKIPPVRRYFSRDAATCPLRPKLPCQPRVC